MKEEETNKGVIRYRMPNIIEATGMMTGLEQGKENEILPQILQRMGILLDLSAHESNSYDELIEDLGMFTPVIEIATEVLTSLSATDGKKKD